MKLIKQDRKTRMKSSETECSFFEQVNKLQNLYKIKKRERAQIDKINNKMGVITNKLPEIKEKHKEIL